MVSETQSMKSTHSLSDCRAKSGDRVGDNESALAADEETLGQGVSSGRPGSPEKRDKNVPTEKKRRK